MSATATPGAKNIGPEDTRLLNVADIKGIERHLLESSRCVERAAMRLDRLSIAQDEDTLGGWPEGFKVSVEAVAAYALLADLIDVEIERLGGFKRTCRDIAPRLYWERCDA